MEEKLFENDFEKPLDFLKVHIYSQWIIKDHIVLNNYLKLLIFFFNFLNSFYIFGIFVNYLKIGVTQCEWLKK